MTEDDSESSACCSNSDYGSDDLEIATLSLHKNCVPKISARKTNVSEARWNYVGRFAGMAEVVKVKGQLLRSTGIVRQGRIYLHIEEVGFLMQREALKVITGDSIMSIMDLYRLIITGEFRCSWDAYKVYLELKTLGYIVGRHDVPWSSSPASPKMLRGESHLNQNLPTREEAAVSSCVKQSESMSSQEENSCRDSTVEVLTKQMKDVACNEAAANRTTASQDSTIAEHGVKVVLDENENTNESHSKEAMEIMPQHEDAKEGTDPGGHWHLNQFKGQIEDSATSSSEILELMFDVFAPNTQFKKTFPGTPEFSVCIQSDCPPKPVDIQALEAQNGGISVKIAVVDCGRVSFFQYNTVQLPYMQ